MVTLRIAVPEDRPLFDAWLAQDKTHQALGLTWDDANEEGTYLALVSDERGPLLFIRVHLALRVAMQFNPATPFRTARAGQDLVQLVKDMAEEEGCKEVIVRPGGKAVHFVNKLGFQNFLGQYLKIRTN